jgi:hypothetical protein
MGRSPWYDDVLRLRKPGMDFFHESPIAFAEEIIKELLLKMGRRELHQFQDRLGVHTLGMNEHNQVEAINRVRGELFDIHIRVHQFASGLKLILLLGYTERGRHSFVSDFVRKQIPVVSHSFHKNDRVGRERLRERPVEVGFADVRHRNQLDRLAVVANVFSHLNRQAGRAQCQEAVAEMIHCQGSAKDKINN